MPLPLRVAVAIAAVALPALARAEPTRESACRGDPPEAGDAFVDIRISQIGRLPAPDGVTLDHATRARGTVTVRVDERGQVRGEGLLFVCEATACAGRCRVEPRRDPIPLRLHGTATADSLDGWIQYGSGAELERLSMVTIGEGAALTLEPSLHAALDRISLAREAGSRAVLPPHQPYPDASRTERAFEYWPVKVASVEDPVVVHHEVAPESSDTLVGGGQFVRNSTKPACQAKQGTVPPEVEVALDTASATWRITRVVIRTCSQVADPLPSAKPQPPDNVKDDPSRGVRDASGVGHWACVAADLLQYPRDYADAQTGRWMRMQWWLADATRFHEEVHRRQFERLVRDAWRPEVWPKLRQALARRIAAERLSVPKKVGEAAGKILLPILNDLQPPRTPGQAPDANPWEDEAYGKTWQAHYARTAEALRRQFGGEAAVRDPPPCPAPRP